jgi:hypothetical protein
MVMVMALIGLAVPDRPIRPLIAEDRSAAGVRDRTDRSVHGAVPGPAAESGAERGRPATPGARVAGRPRFNRDSG